MKTDLETLTQIDKFPAPWGKEIDLKTVSYASGLTMLRITIREKNRFTLMDLDAETASKLAAHIAAWIQQVSEDLRLQAHTNLP